MDVKQKADKYIERGGYMPGERRECFPDDLLKVSNFIGWHDPGHIMGGVKADEAFASLCRLLNMPHAELRKIVRDE